MFLFVLILCGLIEGFAGPSRYDRIAVIGAGPSGVSIAYQLVQKGYSAQNIDIFEQSDRIGGFVQDIITGDTVEAITTFGATSAYWSLIELLPNLNLTACPFAVNENTLFPINVTGPTKTPFSFAQVQYLSTKYGLNFSTPVLYLFHFLFSLNSKTN
jgi:hypothetical protein